MWATTRPGLASRSAASPSPIFVSWPGRKFSTSTSAVRTRSSTIALAFACFRLSVTERLLRACMDHQGATPSTCWPHCRTGSPPGGSTLTTSAPRSASSRVQKGAATKWPSSTTRRPARGPWLGVSVMVLLRDRASCRGASRIYDSPGEAGTVFCSGSCIAKGWGRARCAPPWGHPSSAGAEGAGRRRPLLDRPALHGSRP